MSITSHELERIIIQAIGKAEEIRGTKGKIYSNKSLCELLEVSPKLLAKYRNSGYLGFSKVDDKFWYTQRDVDKFLESNYQNAFNQA